MLLALRIVLGGFMVLAGVMHFVAPRGFERIVPRFLPAPRAIVYVSGLAEISLGAGLFIPAVSHWAAWGLVALYVAIFPANVNMASNRIRLGKKDLPVWMLWARLPLQGVLIAWAYFLT